MCDGSKKNNLELKEFLKLFFDQVTKSFSLDELVLFGSYARGQATDNSDIDLALVSSDLTSTSAFCNTRTIKDKTKFFDPDLQLFSFSPKLYYQEEFIDPGFIQEIKRTGKVIYSKQKGLDLSFLD